MKLIPFLLVFASLASWATADVTSLVAQGDQFDRKFQPDEALKLYQQAEKEAPPTAALLVKIARQYVYRMNSLQNQDAKVASCNTALAYSERAVKEYPNDSDSHLSVAICLGKLIPFMGNRENIEASRRIKQSADNAIRLNPKSDYAWHILGRWHQSLATLGAGKRMIAKVVYGEIPAASNEEAVKCFTKAMELRPDRLIHPIELGRTYAQMNQPAEARRWITKGLAMPNRDFDDPETKERGRQTLAGFD